MRRGRRGNHEEKTLHDQRLVLQYNTKSIIQEEKLDKLNLIKTKNLL